MAAERKAIFTPPFRVSFPSLFKASSYDGGAEKFSVVGLFYPAKFDKPAKKQWAELERIANEASQSEFKKLLKDLPANCRQPFRKGEEKAHLDGYGAGCVFFTMSSKQKPGVVDRDKQDILLESVLYPGCWARASVTAYPYDNKGKGVAFGLHNVQKLGEGENFTGRLSAQEDFGDDADQVWQDDTHSEVENNDDPLG